MMMVEDNNNNNNNNKKTVDSWLTYAIDLVPLALEKAREVKTFQGRWKIIISKLEQIPTRLSDLSSHPCFTKNTLCKEQLEAISKTLNESLELARKDKQQGKLQMQSDLDALSAKIDLHLRDCGLLIKTGILGELLETTTSQGNNITELLARLQIGNLEAKHKALDNLVELMREDENAVLPLLGRSSLSALIQLLTCPIIREKAVSLICTLAESGGGLLVSEGVLPPLIRILESGSSVGREKSATALQRLSMSADTARLIADHGGVPPLIEVCCTSGDAVSQATAAYALKNLSLLPELHQTLAEEGTVKTMIDVLDSGVLLVSKEYAAECLQNLVLSDDNHRHSVITQGGISNLLAYLDGGLPPEPAIRTLRNLVGSVTPETLISLGLLPRLEHALKTGSTGAQTAAIGTICRICESLEAKKVVGESGCILQLLVKLLEVKANEVREVAAQALAGLMTVGWNAREVKRDARSVPSLVQLLDPSPQNTAKKYAVLCLGVLSRSRKCRKVMISYGAIGYLKKLTEMDIIGSKKLLETLRRRSFFGLRF